MKEYEIVSKRRLASNVTEYVIYAPQVARHAAAGQFIILRTDALGERVPFTICDYSREDGTVCILVQEVGYTTKRLAEMSVGDCLSDFVGPLGNPTDLSMYERVCLVGGGIGAAVIYPQAKQLYGVKHVDVILGARTEELLMYREEFAAHCDVFNIFTDDGSAGEKGVVTDGLKRLIIGGSAPDCVFAVGPLGMMKAVCALTETYGIKTVVSLNSIMVDGTGMCGCCRVSVGGRIRYACIDGPEFDGHEVDFDEAIARGRMYVQQEHDCMLRRGAL